MTKRAKRGAALLLAFTLLLSLAAFTAPSANAVGEYYKITVGNGEPQNMSTVYKAACGEGSDFVYVAAFDGLAGRANGQQIVIETNHTLLVFPLSSFHESAIENGQLKPTGVDNYFAGEGSAQDALVAKMSTLLFAVVNGKATIGANVTLAYADGKLTVTGDGGDTAFKVESEAGLFALNVPVELAGADLVLDAVPVGLATTEDGFDVTTLTSGLAGLLDDGIKTTFGGAGSTGADIIVGDGGSVSYTNGDEENVTLIGADGLELGANTTLEVTFKTPADEESKPSREFVLKGDATVHGDMSANSGEKFEIKDGSTLTVSEDATIHVNGDAELKVDEGAKLKVDGDAEVQGTLVVEDLVTGVEIGEGAEVTIGESGSVKNAEGDTIDTNSDGGLKDAIDAAALEKAKAALTAKIAEAAGYLNGSRGRYTSDSLAALRTALVAAQTALADEDATVTSVNAALATLEAAIEELVSAANPARPSTGGGGSSAPETSEPGEAFKEQPSTAPEAPKWVSPFADVKPGDWYHDAVEYVVQRNLFNGTGKGFEPNANMTRAMLITVLGRLDGQDTAGGAQWYSKAVEWGTAKGITDGLNLEANVTREQIVTMLYRYAGLGDGWGGDALRWAEQKKIMTGGRPNDFATRAEVAAMIMRFADVK